MKAIMYLICFLLIAGSVAAIEALPREKCYWVRPATEYRLEKEFQGVYVRMSDGSIQCTMPSGKKYVEVKKVVKPILPVVMPEPPVCVPVAPTCKWIFNELACHRHHACIPTYKYVCSGGVTC